MHHPRALHDSFCREFYSDLKREDLVRPRAGVGREHLARDRDSGHYRRYIQMEAHEFLLSVFVILIQHVGGKSPVTLQISPATLSRREPSSDTWPPMLSAWLTIDQGP